MLNKTNCDQERVAKFLRNELDQASTREFETHLDSCESCQSLLEDSAGEAGWWDDVREYLPQDRETLDDSTNLSLQEIISLLAPSENPQMLGRFGGYEIAGVIGQGGMSVVLKGFDESLNRFVAIKVLAPQLAVRGSARNRFAREAKAAAAVVHDNVVAIHGVSEFDGLPYLIMPYVRGESLQKLIQRTGPLTPLEIVRISHQAASGLSAAHAQGLVHRDVKPANLLLPVGIQRVLITDFGLARAVDDSDLTGTGTIAGTPEFMSPEQAMGETIDARSDLFSLGTVIYTMCTGRSPFRASNSFGVLKRIVDDSPRAIREINPSIPEWLETLVSKLHAKNPARRYQSAAELASVLEQCLAHLQTPRAPLPADLRTPFPKSRSWIYASIALIVPLLLTVAMTSFNFPGNKPEPRPNHDSVSQWNQWLLDQQEEDEESIARIEKRLSQVKLPSQPELTTTSLINGPWELESAFKGNKKLLSESTSSASKHQTVFPNMRIKKSKLWLSSSLALKDSGNVENELNIQKGPISNEPKGAFKSPFRITDEKGGLHRYSAKVEFSNGFAHRLTLTGVDETIKEESAVRYVFRRPKDHPVSLKNKINQIKQVVHEHYSQRNHMAYRLCDHMLDIAESYEREAAHRQQYLELQQAAKQLEGTGQDEILQAKIALSLQVLERAADEQSARVDIKREYTDKQRTREKFQRLIEQMSELQKEGNQEAVNELKTEMLALLQSQDDDYEQLKKLRSSMVQLRLRGNHAEAEKVEARIDQLESELRKRYGDVERRTEKQNLEEKAYRLIVMANAQTNDPEKTRIYFEQLEQVKKTYGEKYGPDELRELKLFLKEALESAQKSQRKKNG